jgi:hypothetical protein
MTDVGALSASSNPLNKLSAKDKECFESRKLFEYPGSNRLGLIHSERICQYGPLDSIPLSSHDT